MRREWREFSEFRQLKFAEANRPRKILPTLTLSQHAERFLFSARKIFGRLSPIAGSTVIMPIAAIIS
jgi:hypothetical protein